MIDMDINIQKKMEENTIKMKPIVGKKKVAQKEVSKAEKPAQPTTEQLTQLIDQLYGRNQQLVEALNEKNTALMFKRMDYLFKIVEQSHMFDDEFVTKCIDELQKTLDVTQIETNMEDGEQDQ